MRIIVAGSFKYNMYDEACAEALEEIGFEVFRFAWQNYYGTGQLSKIQQRFLLGPGIARMNIDLIRMVNAKKPDILFITRGVPIWPKTINTIKNNGYTKIVSNNNDNPFGHKINLGFWRYFIKSIPYYDVNFVFRENNVQEYYLYGAKNVQVLLPYYVPKLHYPILLTKEEQEKYYCDVVFVGNAQDDDRMIFFEMLSRKKYNFRVHGLNWHRLTRKYSWLNKHCFPAAWGINYNRIVSAANISLLFFSRKNKDTYTTRSFELPALGACMLSERTNDMLYWFREDKEAAYFSSTDELLGKVDWLLSNAAIRKAISKEATRRVKEIGGSVNDRMQQVVNTVRSI